MPKTSRIAKIGATLSSPRKASQARAAIATDQGLAPRALAGGDDYELLFTARPESAQAVSRIADALELPLTRIGEIVAGGAVVMLGGDGRPIDLPPAWEHFASE